MEAINIGQREVFYSEHSNSYTVFEKRRTGWCQIGTFKYKTMHSIGIEDNWRQALDKAKKLANLI